MADKFFWYELMTPDLEASKAFYGHVVGWTFAEMGGGGDMPYTIISAGERPVGGIFTLTDEMCEGGARPGWLGYIHAEDVDAKVAEVKAAGGVVQMEPRDVPLAGRIAMVADPGGAPFYLMAPQPPEGAEPPPPIGPTEVGVFSWHELYAGQGQAAAFDFYAKLFGWDSMMEMEMGPMGIYRLFGADGVHLGGMMDKPANLPCSVWGFYTTVDGIDGAVARLTEKGGQVLTGPHQVPGDSWIVQAMDPQGAAFALTAATR
ncbi:MAG TPA: VOC family protein [Allosphingosinicella sp.]|nr:VOC family protein [Allosphingosinicella sp.]